MTWSEFEERYGESREDFIEVEAENVDRCTYCDSVENVVRRSFKLFNQSKTELICEDCLAEELRYENELQEPAGVA